MFLRCRSSVWAPTVFLVALWTCVGQTKAQKAGTSHVAVGFVDSFGESDNPWRLISIFPFIRKCFQSEGLELGRIALLDVKTEQDLWQQLKQFQVLLLPEPSNHPALAKVLRQYLSAGGGVLLIGARLGANVETLLPDCGLKFQQRGIQDPATSTAGGMYWWTQQVTPHSLTEGVRCLAFPKVGDYQRIATQLMECSSEWQVLVRAEKSARVFDLRQTHTSGTPEWVDVGLAAQPPLFAVRQQGKARLAALPAGAEWILYNLGNPAFPQVFMRLGDSDKNPSDGWRLMLNTVQWLAEPARAAGVLGGYDPPASPPVPEFPKAIGLKPPLAVETGPPSYRGLVGLHSSLSDGQATVAEYARAARESGLSFVVFTDPWEELTDEEYTELQRQCEAVSNDSFRALRGIQYTDKADIRWVYFDPEFLPRAEYLEKDGKRVEKDGLYTNNAGGKAFRLARMPLSVSKLSTDPRNLYWHHFMAPWEYEEARVVSDNAAAYLMTVGCGMSSFPVAYAEIKNPDELRRAAKQCVMVLRAATLAEATKQILPESLPAWPLYNYYYAYVTQGPQIDQFSMAEWNHAGGRLEYTSGQQYLRFRVSASSPIGLAEVALLHGHHGQYRRFLPRGAKEFTQAWTGLHDGQYAFVVRVKDSRGRMAYSTPRVAFSNVRGLYYCQDNQNALQNQNTPFYSQPLHEFPGYPPNWTPFFFGWRGWDGMQNMVKQVYISAPYIDNVEALEGTDLPPGQRRYERAVDVPLASYFCNVFRTRTSHVIELPSTPDGWPPLHCRRVVGDTKLTDQELTSTIPACRANLETFWFRPEFAHLSLAAYKAALTLFEGTLRFKRDLTLKRRISLAAVLAIGRKADMDSAFIYQPGKGIEKVSPVRGFYERELPPGSFVAAGPLAGSPFLANISDGPLTFSMCPDTKKGPDGQPCYFGEGGFSIGSEGQKIAAGMALRFRIVTAYLAEGDTDPGGVARDLAASLNLDGGTSGYPLQIKRGKLVDPRFALTLAAENGEAEFVAGPRRMYIDLPVRIKGISDNGCIAFYEKKIGHFIFVPTLDGDALFQVAIDGSADVWVGNVFRCNDPHLRLTLIGADEGKPRLEVHNPTDEKRKVRITSPPHAPMFGGWSGEVTVEGGSSASLEVRASR